MVSIDINPLQSPADKGPTSAPAGAGTPFVLQNDEQGVSFTPKYFPETLRRTKERNLNRKDQFCEGENVSDQGSKNWEIHAVGRLLTPEIISFDQVAEKGNELLLTSASWSGEVLVASVELDGPVAFDPDAQEHQWRYTVDLVSTGEDELGEQFQDGIIDDGDEVQTNFPGGRII